MTIPALLLLLSVCKARETETAQKCTAGLPSYLLHIDTSFCLFLTLGAFVALQYSTRRLTLSVQYDKEEAQKFYSAKAVITTHQVAVQDGDLLALAQTPAPIFVGKPWP